jgi:hypothetical protein
LASTSPFFHLVADVDDPLQDVGGRLGIDRRALIALDEAGLPHDPDDLPNLRPQKLHCQGLGGAYEFDRGVVTASGRRQGDHEREHDQAVSGGTIG